eukprot:gb/GEZN01014796.1/.p1 GENE.gb/GEZN01014796.1/~~gb/GEZN01014796.1/.p1  ORF type:complete len:279 (+),score=61.34 gb/GEZN01014796.1/:33-839(+)
MSRTTRSAGKKNKTEESARTEAKPLKKQKKETAGGAKAKKQDLWSQPKNFTAFTVSLQDGKTTLTVDVPEGIRIGPTPFGRGVFASKDFKKGEVLYRGGSVLVPNRAGKHHMVMKYPDGTTETVELDMIVHSVCDYAAKVRHVFSFDCFMNHSCDPTTESKNENRTDTYCMYDTVARRDIKAGEEINCDYNLFEWDCKDKGIDVCACKALNCKKVIHGFSNLDLATQKKMLPLAAPEVQEQWRKEFGEKTEKKAAPKKKGKGKGKASP